MRVRESTGLGVWEGEGDPRRGGSVGNVSEHSTATGFLGSWEGLLPSPHQPRGLCSWIKARLRVHGWGTASAATTTARSTVPATSQVYQQLSGGFLCTSGMPWNARARRRAEQVASSYFRSRFPQHFLQNMKSLGSFLSSARSAHGPREGAAHRARGEN